MAEQVKSDLGEAGYSFEAPKAVLKESAEDLLDLVASFLRRFVAFPSPAALDAVTLWVFHAHVMEAFESTPRLALLSPEKGSGKTRTLEVLDLLVPNPMHAVNLSAAALFRKVGGDAPPTVLLDEADTYLGLRVAKDHEEVRGLVNAGHRRGAVAYRCVGDPSKMEVVEFPAFAPVALAGIGDLPDTIIDRSIVVKMRRRSHDEHVDSFRLRKVRPEGDILRGKLEVWGAANAEKLQDIEPVMPAGIVDRPADVWEPLLAVAEVAGSRWRERATSACLGLNKEREKADVSLGIQLLKDVFFIFEELAEEESPLKDRLSSQELVKRLCSREESPWGDLRGKEIDPRGLARRLKPYEIRPADHKFDDDKTKKGYLKEDFVDAWRRYLNLSLPPGGATRATEATEEPGEEVIGPEVAAVADVAHFAGRERHLSTEEIQSRLNAVVVT